MPSPDGKGPDGTAPGGVAAGHAAVAHDGDVCRVSGTLDFDTAREVLETVVPIVERGAVARIDLGGVTRSNSAGLALMVEWRAVATRGGHPLAFENVPDGLRQLAGVCRVDALVGIPG